MLPVRFHTRVEGAVRALDRELAHPGEVTRILAENTLGRLDETDAVRGVAARLIQRADLGTQAFGDTESGGIVCRRRDAQAG